MTKHRRYHRRLPLPVATQIALMEARHRDFRLASWRCGAARWVGVLRPTDISVRYGLTISYRLGVRPRVYVTAPELMPRGEAEIPHLHADGTLCLHLPGEWNSTMAIAETIVPWAALWLYYYEVWHATGEWCGGGAHPALRPSIARRLAEAARLREAITAGVA